MSKQAHLPPRCPFQKKPISRPTYDPFSPTSSKDDRSYPRHHKSASQSSILEEHPPWLDDLLSDSDSTSKGITHRRSASDSTTLLDGLVDPFSSLTPFDEEENLVDRNTCNGLEAACLYGPNSPRQKGNLSFSGNAIVTALSDCVSQSPPKFIHGTFSIPGMTSSDLKADGFGLAGDINAETKAAKRHSGQRSRVRKLQYIAELERTVGVFQALESELTVRVASLVQQRVALSMENSKLKHQVAKLQQENLIVDGQYQHLKKEVERLKTGLTNSPNSTVLTYLGSSPAVEAIRSKNTWQMLDMGKLNIH